MAPVGMARGFRFADSTGAACAGREGGGTAPWAWPALSRTWGGASGAREDPSAASGATRRSEVRARSEPRERSVRSGFAGPRRWAPRWPRSHRRPRHRRGRRPPRSPGSVPCAARPRPSRAAWGPAAARGPSDSTLRPTRRRPRPRVAPPPVRRASAACRLPRPRARHAGAREPRARRSERSPAARTAPAPSPGGRRSRSVAPGPSPGSAPRPPEDRAGHRAAIRRSDAAPSAEWPRRVRRCVRIERANARSRARRERHPATRCPSAHRPCART